MDKDLLRDKKQFPGSHLVWGLLQELEFDWPQELWVDVFLNDNRVIRNVQILSGRSPYYFKSDPYIQRHPGDFGLPDRHIKEEFKFGDDDVLLIREKDKQMDYELANRQRYPMGFLQQLGLLPKNWGNNKYNPDEWVVKVEEFEVLPSPSTDDLYRQP